MGGAATAGSLSSVRVVAITSGQHVAHAQLPSRVAALAAAAPRGTLAFQVREKELDGAPLFDLVRAVVAAARPFGALVLVNDRVDVALAAGADGVHLPERGMGPADARAVAALAQRSLLVGCSRHTPDAAAAATRDGADLVQLGPVWPTPGKDTPCGLEAIAATHAQRTAGGCLVAVGGIDSLERAYQAARAGADAIAAIRGIWQPRDPGGLLARLIEAVELGRAGMPAPTSAER